MSAKVPLPLVVPVALAAAAGAAAAGDGGTETAIAAGGAGVGATAQQVHALVDLYYLYPRCYIHLFHIAIFYDLFLVYYFLFSKEPRIATPHSHPGCENQGNNIPKIPDSLDLIFYPICGGYLF